MSESNEQAIREALEQSSRQFKVSRRSFIIDCPSCSKEEKCYVEKSSGRSICWVCGTKWSLKAIVSAILGISFQEADARMKGIVNGNAKLQNLILKFKDLADDSNELTDADFEDAQSDPAYKPFYFDYSFVEVWKSEEGMSYLLKRGISKPSTWVRHGLRYQGGMNAIVAPVVMYGITVGYQARFIAPRDESFRMRTSDNLPRDRSVLNYDNAAKCDRVLVVEGIFDCLATDLPEHGLASIATMGKTINEGQIDLILNLPATRIYIGLDADAANATKSWGQALVSPVMNLEARLCASKEVFRMVPPAGRKDFGECSTEEIVEAMENAEPCSASRLERLEVFMKR